VIAKSFSRIHRANLINMGILPLVFTAEGDYEAVEQGDAWEIDGVHAALEAGEPLTVRNVTQGTSYSLACDLTDRQVAIILSGGLLNYIKAGGQ
jgi:aconitate hydratase